MRLLFLTVNCYCYILLRCHIGSPQPVEVDRLLHEEEEKKEKEEEEEEDKEKQMQK